MNQFRRLRRAKNIHSEWPTGLRERPTWALRPPCGVVTLPHSDQSCTRTFFSTKFLGPQSGPPLLKGKQCFIHGELKVTNKVIYFTSWASRRFFFLFGDLFRAPQNYILGGSKPSDAPLTRGTPKLHVPRVTGASDALEPPRSR